MNAVLTDLNSTASARVLPLDSDQLAHRVPAAIADRPAAKTTTLLYAVARTGARRAAGIGRVVRRASLVGALCFIAAVILGFILDRRPHSQRRV